MIFWDRSLLPNCAIFSLGQSQERLNTGVAETSRQMRKREMLLGAIVTIKDAVFFCLIQNHQCVIKTSNSAMLVANTLCNFVKRHADVVVNPRDVMRLWV